MISNVSKMGRSSQRPDTSLVRRLAIGAAVFFSTVSTSWAATYYVSNSGSNVNTGTSLDKPFQTIQTAVNKAVAGDTIYVRGGTYREEISMYRGGGTAGNYLTISGYENEVPVIKGSSIVTGWTLHGGNIWKKTGWTVNSQQVFVDLQDDKGLQQIGMPSTSYGSFEYPTPVGSGLSSMVAGSFYYDAATSTLYVWLPDGSSPNDHIIEASTKKRLLYIGVSYVYLKRLAFRHSASSGFSKQGAAVELGAYTIMDQCDVQYTDFTGVTMGYQKTGAQLINSNVSNNGNSGVNAPASYNFRVGGNKINGNNYRKFNPLWHAGGIKATTKAYGVVDLNEFGNNYGSGIWFDYANGGSQIVVKNNYVHDNGPKEAAIFMEVTKNAAIYNNVLVNNERRGIYISASDNMRVYNNTVNGTKGYAGIEVNGMPRSGATLTQNNVFNNIISNSTSTYDLFMVKENATTIAGNKSNYNNIYRQGGTLKLSNGTPYTTLLAWQKASQQDMNSLTVDPAFANVASTTNVNILTPASRYSLAAASPMINAGTILSDVKEDFVSAARPYADTHDIGAFENVATTPVKDTIAPVVQIGNPAQEGAIVKGSVTITASAVDNVAVTGMKLYIDGALKATSNNGQLSYSWNTAGLRLGTHSMWISASDAKNNLGKVYRNVKVQ